MSMTTTAHINFRGEARHALEFYQTVFGGDVTLATYRDLHSAEDPSQENLIAWGQVSAPTGFRVMAYDVQPSKGFNPGENAFYIAIHCNNSDGVKAFWEPLSAGATILAPLAPAVFAPLYGMLTDRFGVTWIIDVATE